jgi:hypothetical protein
VTNQTEADESAEFERELASLTLRVYERYAVEVVEQFGFCPWAHAARTSESAPVRVVFSVNQDDFEESLTHLDTLSQADSEHDVALLVYPLLDLGRLDFEDYVRRLRTRSESDERDLTAFAMAAFHPHAEADLGHPDRLVPFVRRSPDPTLQLVRKSALSSIKGLDAGTQFVDVAALGLLGGGALSGIAAIVGGEPTKPVRQRIAEQNLATVRERGAASIEAVLHDIFGEREAGHEGLLRRHGQRGPRRFIPG